MKWSEVLSIRVSTNSRIYIDHMQFAACMAYSFITFFHIFLVPFLSVYICVCVCACVWGCMFCMLLYNFVNYVFLLMFTCLYCYVCCVLCILFHCVVLCIVCVQTCSTVLLPPGVNPIAVNEINNNIAGTGYFRIQAYAYIHH
jgi:hypothetical protein